MNRFTLSCCLLFAVPVLAANRAELVSRAVDDVKEALDEASDAPAACKKKLTPKLDALDDAIRAAKKDPSDSAIKSAQRAADRAADVAEEACTGSTGKRLSKALAGASKALDDALDVKEDSGPPPVLGAIAQGIGINLDRAARQMIERALKLLQPVLLQGVVAHDSEREDQRPGDRRRGTRGGSREEGEEERRRSGRGSLRRDLQEEPGVPVEHLLRRQWQPRLLHEDVQRRLRLSKQDVRVGVLPPQEPERATEAVLAGQGLRAAREPKRPETSVPSSPTSTVADPNGGPEDPSNERRPASHR